LENSELQQATDETGWISWGMNANTLQVSILALCYLIAEYCAQPGRALLTPNLSMHNCTLPCASSLALSVHHLYFGFWFWVILNVQLYDVW